MYSIFVFLGLNLYVAQILAHVIGATFNYFMFKHHVFHGAKPNVLSYVGSYGINYLLGLAFLTTVHRVVASPYLAGFIALVAVSFVNYFMLRIFVFKGGDRKP